MIRNLLKYILPACLLISPLFVHAQEEEETKSKKWKFHSVGVAFMDGNAQFFDAYNHEVLIGNSRAGLPIYGDWQAYQPSSIMPEYFQAGIHAGILDTTRNIRLRFGFAYSQRRDSMAYVSGFAINDTIFGRNASEQASYYSLMVTGIKATRKKIAKLFRFYGGAVLEVAFSPRSEINFLEYSYDFGDMKILELNEFPVSGKPRFQLFANALVGLEVVIAKRIGVFGELRSGIGGHIVIGERPAGIAKNIWLAGLHYYFLDY